MPRSAVHSGRSVVLAAALALFAVLGLQSTATASTSATRPAAGAAAATTRPVDVHDLGLVGTRTSVTVRRVYRTGQKAWINHVLDSRLVDVDGCQGRRLTTWRAHVYRATVYAVCPAGPAAQESAARALAASRPWYRVSVTRVPLVAFSLLADLTSGNDRAVPAAIAQLPKGPAVFYEGDDVSLTYSAPGVTQTQLDAAVAAFARALGVPVSKVSVRALAG